MEFDYLNNYNLEPRLIEYLEKLNFYKKNKMEPDLPLEIMYSISEQDIETINKSVGPKQKISKNRSIKKAKNPKPEFEKPLNRGMFVPDDPSKSTYDDIVDPDKFLVTQEDGKNFSNKYSQSRFITNRHYTHPPKLDYKLRLHPTQKKADLTQHQSDLNNVLTGLHSYAQKASISMESSAEMDEISKVNVPSVSSRGKKSANANLYMTSPFIDPLYSLKNTQLESNMRGLPSGSRKTIGHPNPFEHYFQYIGSDIQDPDHIIMDFPRGGYDTRGFNHQMRGACYNERDVM